MPDLSAIISQIPAKLQPWLFLGILAFTHADRAGRVLINCYQGITRAGGLKGLWHGLINGIPAKDPETK